MIASLTGLIAERDGETLVIQTDGGVGYAVTVPLGVAARLPTRGARVSLFTELVVKEDGWALYGFDSGTERQVFRHLLTASGFGPKLAARPALGARSPSARCGAFSRVTSPRSAR